MTRVAINVFTWALVAALTSGSAAAQGLVPEAGLAAEGEGRWADALGIYRRELERNPRAADLWLRVADIEAGLGHTEEALAALDAAASAAPGNASIHARLSQAYAATGHATAALRAIEAALAVDAGSLEYLRAHATLATWAGEYAAAARSYRQLIAAAPGDADLTLALARVNLWSGRSDAAASAYRIYLSGAAAPSPEAWLELARAESWRGNLPNALRALARYQSRFGDTPMYRRELAASLARGGRPRAALRELDALIAASPDDYDLRLSRTVALATVRHHGAAATSLHGADTLKPGHADTRAAEGLLRTLVGSHVGPATNVYSDSDGLQQVRFAPRFDIGLRSDTRIHGGYEHLDLKARVGSGLDQVAGPATAAMDHGFAGLSQRLGPLTLGGTIGQARTDAHEHTTYTASVRFAPVDTLSASVERASGFFTISPRTVGLGLTRVGHRAQIDWNPSIRTYLALEGSFEELSDGNARWEVFVSPRVAAARTASLNLDLGLLLHQFGAREDLDHGYYDPTRYEYYSVVVMPYWKVSENVGVAFTGGLGGQRDERSPSFRLGGNASAEASFGIYERWLLKVHASVTNNRRLDSGAFRGYSGGVVLLRRF